MKQRIAVFNSQKEAVAALKKLKDNDFPMKDVSLIGKAEVTDEHVHHIDGTNVPAYVGMGAGGVLGALAGLGVFAIPGFGMIFGAGAVIGAIAGIDLGIVGGGFVSLMTKLFVKDEHTEKIKQHLEEGKVMLVVNGPEEEIHKAEKILEEEDLYTHIYV